MTQTRQKPGAHHQTKLKAAFDIPWKLSGLQKALRHERPGNDEIIDQVTPESREMSCLGSRGGGGGTLLKLAAE